MTTFPNTGSTVNRGLDDPTLEGRTSTGLSTQIVIKINNVAVGALQRLTVSQNRPLARINEIGLDGNVEIVPNQSTTFELTADRIVFDQLRLPEAFSRSFRFINAQRVPFDIEIFDINGQTDPLDANSGGIVVMKFVNCWFTRYETPYNAENYLITETAGIWAETGQVSSPDNFAPENESLRTIEPQTDAAAIESAVNRGGRRGGVDAAGLIKAIFNT